MNVIRSSWLAIAVGPDVVQKLQCSAGATDCDGHFFMSQENLAEIAVEMKLVGSHSAHTAN